MRDGTLGASSSMTSAAVDILFGSLLLTAWIVFQLRLNRVYFGLSRAWVPPVASWRGGVIGLSLYALGTLGCAMCASGVQDVLVICGLIPEAVVEFPARLFGSILSLLIECRI